MLEEAVRWSSGDVQNSRRNQQCQCPVATLSGYGSVRRYQIRERSNDRDALRSLHTVWNSPSNAPRRRYHSGHRSTRECCPHNISITDCRHMSRCPILHSIAMRRTSQIPSVLFQNDGGRPHGRRPVRKGRSWDGVMAHMNAWENGIFPDIKADFEARNYGT